MAFKDKKKKDETTKENATENVDNVSTNETGEVAEEATVTLSKEEQLALDLVAEKDKYMRLVAEYDNFRKRSSKEKLEMYGDATVKAVNDILPVYDNFERALSAETADENFKKGMEMIFNMLKEALKKLGIEEIDPTGQEFDPEIAQAVNQIEDENLGSNIVAQVFQKGYKLGDKIIRYAMVVVANP